MRRTAPAVMAMVMALTALVSAPATASASSTPTEPQVDAHRDAHHGHDHDDGPVHEFGHDVRHFGLDDSAGWVPLDTSEAQTQAEFESQFQFRSEDQTGIQALDQHQSQSHAATVAPAALSGGSGGYTIGPEGLEAKYTLQLKEFGAGWEHLVDDVAQLAAQSSAATGASIGVGPNLPGTLTQVLPGMIVVVVGDACNGMAGCASINHSQGRISSAVISIRTSSANNLSTMPVLLHEMGHALGLGHFGGVFEGQIQVMNPGLAGGATTFRSGDLNGLARMAFQGFAGSGVPDAPTGVGVTPGSGSAVLTWAAPWSPVLSPITKYTVTASPGGKTCTWSSGPLTCTVTGLTNGTAHTFTVRATNAKGQGPASVAVAAKPSATPDPSATIPGAPTGVSVTVGNASAVLNWVVPASMGGDAITKYTVTASPGGKICTWSSGPLTCTVTGLTNGTTYTFTVRATNGVGQGPASAASAAVTPYGIPGAPTGATAVAGDGSALVSWVPPADNGGKSISYYFVTASPGGKTCTTLFSAGALSCTVTGLTNGVGYTFKVKAANSAGWGPESVSSAAVTPTGTPGPPVQSTVPGAPAGVGATPGNGSAVLSWAAPSSTGGSPITKYTVSASPGGKSCSTTGGLSCTVTGLTNGTSYVFRVKATNVVGEGPASVPSAAVVPYRFSDVAPGAPFFADIEWMVSSGVTTGYLDGSFRPGDAVSRQAMAAFLYRLEGSPDGPNPSCSVAPFSDVSIADGFCGYISWMKRVNITTGNSDGSFRPGQVVSRQAMAAFLSRL